MRKTCYYYLVIQCSHLGLPFITYDCIYMCFWGKDIVLMAWFSKIHFILMAVIVDFYQQQFFNLLFYMHNAKIFEWPPESVVVNFISMSVWYAVWTCKLSKMPYIVIYCVLLPNWLVESHLPHKLCCTAAC